MFSDFQVPSQDLLLSKGRIAPISFCPQFASSPFPTCTLVLFYRLSIIFDPIYIPVCGHELLGLREARVGFKQDQQGAVVEGLL
jgi:hypothetical protein